MPPRLSRTHVVRQILGSRTVKAVKAEGVAFAPSNIALAKYWGKRHEELNLPVTSSLSISLGALGTETRIALEGTADRVLLNGAEIPHRHKFARGVTQYLNLFRADGQFFRVDTANSIPTAAGLASSASGFAALILALQDLCGWNLPPRDLSILARLGSGSASRSIFRGFVQWHAGVQADGMDCFAEELPHQWPDLRVGLLTLSEAEKSVGSREAMKRTKRTSMLYEAWPSKVEHDLSVLHDAIASGDFDRLGQTAESNALSMHATGLGAWPPVLFWLPETVATLHRLWSLREEGLRAYCTMDAGPNVKLLFLAEDESHVLKGFPAVRVISPFAA